MRRRWPLIVLLLLGAIGTYLVTMEWMPARARAARTTGVAAGQARRIPAGAFHPNDPVRPLPERQFPERTLERPAPIPDDANITEELQLQRGDPRSAHTRYRGFQRTWRWILMVDDEPVHFAKVFELSARGVNGPMPFATILRNHKIEGYVGQTLLLRHVDRNVFAVPRDDVMLPAMDVRDLAADLTTRFIGRIETSVGSPRELELRRLQGATDRPMAPIATLRRVEALSGPQDLAAVQASNPAFLPDQARFRLDAVALRDLRRLDGPIEIELFFATDSLLSNLYMGRILALAAALDESTRLRLYAVPERSARAEDPLVQRHEINVLPTALIHRNGAVVGRIEGYHWARPARALLRALSRRR